MSISRDVELECPDCGAKSPAEIWSTVNVDLDPQAKEQLLEGKINIFRCDYCGCQKQVAVSLLYHDMTKKFVAQYVPFPTTEDSDYLDSVDDDGLPELPQNLPEEHMPLYFSSIHVVFSMNELARYVIFRDRLAQYKGMTGKDGQASREQ